MKTKELKNSGGMDGKAVALTLLGTLAAREPDGVLRVPIEEIDVFMTAEHTIEIHHEEGEGPFEVTIRTVNAPIN